MTEKKQDKAKLPQKDAEVELTEDDLTKVSGGVNQQGTDGNFRTRPDEHPAFKVEIQK